MSTYELQGKPTSHSSGICPNKGKPYVPVEMRHNSLGDSNGWEGRLILCNRCEEVIGRRVYRRTEDLDDKFTSI